jgi:hypothetical protein
MAIVTFAAAINDNAFTEVVDGATVASFGLQRGDQAFPFAIIIAATLPAADAGNYMEIGKSDPSMSLDIGETDKVYARSLRGKAVVRGYKVDR